MLNIPTNKEGHYVIVMLLLSVSNQTKGYDFVALVLNQYGCWWPDYVTVLRVFMQGLVYIVNAWNQNVTPFLPDKSGGVTQLEERRVSIRKVAKPRFDFRCGRVAHRCVLGIDTFKMLFFILGPSNLPVVVAQPDEKHANRTLQTQSIQHLVQTKKTSQKGFDRTY